MRKERDSQNNEEFPPAFKALIIAITLSGLIALFADAVARSDGFNGPPGYRQEYLPEKK